MKWIEEPIDYDTFVDTYKSGIYKHWRVKHKGVFYDVANLTMLEWSIFYKKGYYYHESRKESK